MDEYEEGDGPYTEFRPIYTLFLDDRSPRAAVIRHQRHRALIVVAACPTKEAARAALRLMLLETNHGN